MNFFFDRGVAVRLARMLAAYDGHNVATHQDDDDARFHPRSKDVEIIRPVARDEAKPVYLAADLSSRTVPEERAALRDSAMTIGVRRQTVPPHGDSSAGGKTADAPAASHPRALKAPGGDGV